MKGSTLAVLVSAAVLASTVWGQAGLTQNPYAIIATRNAFGVKPVPTETTTTTKPPLPPVPGVEVFLTGIFTVGGTEKVLLQVTDKTPGRKTEHLPPLVEKDVEGRVEVVSIDADNDAVVIRIDGDERTLTFEKDAPKPSPVTPVVLPRNPYVRATMPVPPSLPTAPATTPGRLGVWVGGANTSSTAGPSLPVAPSANPSGAMNRGIPVVPNLPPRMYGR